MIEYLKGALINNFVANREIYIYNLIELICGLITTISLLINSKYNLNLYNELSSYGEEQENSFLDFSNNHNQSFTSNIHSSENQNGLNNTNNNNPNPLSTSITSNNSIINVNPSENNSENDSYEDSDEEMQEEEHPRIIREYLGENPNQATLAEAEAARESFREHLIPCSTTGPIQLRISAFNDDTVNVSEELIQRVRDEVVVVLSPEEENTSGIARVLVQDYSHNIRHLSRVNINNQEYFFDEAETFYEYDPELVKDEMDID